MATMTPVNSAIPTAQAGAIGRCQVCGNMRQTALVKYQHNIGMIFLRQTRSIQGNMCKTCVGKKFWEYSGKNLLLGPWGMISLVITPVYLVTNIVAYSSASRKLSGAVE
jgi:hypothetical protein